MKPLIVDSPKCGHSIINLSTKDMTYSPSIIPTIHFEPPKEEYLSTKNKSVEYMLSRKCPLFTVVPYILSAMFVLSQSSMKIDPLIYLTRWFMCLYTTLPCWETVLFIWSQFMDKGVPVLFQSALTIMELLQS